ncbi:DUF3618 domain-containing protein [Limimaricola sp. AA108-03]|uniref:DUF3618 domain-containing protein n=1 Tax=Limimaricola sp. AA108-03 TaxID=3425945 RepID=UPI003D76E73E
MADDTGNYTRSPEEIERDIAAERQQLHDTIDEALSRFTFEDAWNRAGGYLKENRSEFGHSFGRVLRERPMGVVLTAVGLAWLFFGPKETARRRSFSSRRLADERARDRTKAERAAYLAEEWETQVSDRKPGVSDLPGEPPVEPTRPVSSPVSTGVSPTPSASGAVPVTPQKRDASASPRGSEAVQPASMTPSAPSASTSAEEPMKSADHSPDPATPTKESDRKL